MPRNPMDSQGIRPYTSGQEKVLRKAEEEGLIRNVPHSVARALRDRNLGDIVSKEGSAFPNGHRPMTRGFPTVTFRLNGLGRTEAARLLMAVGDCQSAENVQVTHEPASNL